MDPQPLWRWMIGRHAIYERRRRGEPGPWSDDPIFQTWKFCNVYRELDLVTRWIREKWRQPHAEDENLWFAMCVARMINWPPTLEKIGYPRYWDARRVYDDLRLRALAGQKVFTGAYIISGSYGLDKAHGVVFKVLDPLFKNPELPRPHDNLEGYWRRLAARPGFGPFMAYEVVTDLRHTRYLRDADDLMTWANPGPGAKRGLNRLLGRPASEGMSSHFANGCMRALLAESRRMLPGWMPPCEMRDIEHSLCETDKYLRIANGEGRPRSRFLPGQQRFDDPTWEYKRQDQRENRIRTKAVAKTGLYLPVKVW